MASNKLNAIEKALLEEAGGDSLIIMINRGTNDDTPNERVLRFITQEGGFNVAEYFIEYGEIDVDNVIGNILEMPDYKKALQGLNDQWNKHLEAS